MRAILLTRDGRHYVLRDRPIGDSTNTVLVGTLATGGELVVPTANWAALEVYRNGQEEALRARLDELRQLPGGAGPPIGAQLQG